MRRGFPVPGCVPPGEGPDHDTDGDLMVEDAADATADSSDSEGHAASDRESHAASDLETGDLHDQPARRPIIDRLVGLVVVLGMLALVTHQPIQTLLSTPSGLFADAHELTGDPRIAAWRQAVVQISSDGRGSSARRGTGFHIGQGLIVTNRHLVEDAGGVTIRFPQQPPVQGTTWQEHPAADLALIMTEDRGLPAVPLAQSAQAQVTPGEQVFIIGSPLGFANVPVRGQVRGSGRIAGYGGIPVAAVDIAAPIHPGSSGSPVINQQGQVVAVVFARLPGTEDAPVRGLAVLISELAPLVDGAL